MHRKFLGIIIFIFVYYVSDAQELQARISIVTSKVSSQVDKKVFQTMQSALNNFINNRKWTNDNYQASEKINCSFLITIDKNLEIMFMRAHSPFKPQGLFTTQPMNHRWLTSRMIISLFVM
jgi:Flp pilus assembly protein TadG